MQILSDFGVQPVLLLAQVVNFTILLLILKRLVYKPVVNLLEERKRKIAESLVNAERIETHLQQTAAEREKILDGARTESKKIISEASDIADTIRAEAEKNAVKHLEQSLKRSEEAAARRMQEMETRLKRDVVKLVVETLKVTTEKVLTKEDQDKIIAKDVELIAKQIR